MAHLEATGTLPSLAISVVRSSALPTASVTTHPGCTMRMSVDQAFRKCQSRPRNKEEPPRTKCAGWLEKVGAAKKHQNKNAPNTSLTSRQNKMALPPILKGDDDSAGTADACNFFPDLGEKSLAAAEREQRPRATLLQGKTKQKARGRGSPRRVRSKRHEMKLPPVPSITNLNFSRSFTFSFFELPPHQSHQYWVQRQQLISLLMKQLQ